MYSLRLEQELEAGNVYVILYLEILQSDYVCHIKQGSSRNLVREKHNNRLPQFIPKSKDMELRDIDKHKKLKMKLYADERNHVKKSNMTAGDNVLVKQQKDNKLSTHFDPKPCQIKDKNWTLVTAEREVKSISRNSSIVKPIRGPIQVPSAKLVIYRDNPMVMCYKGYTVKDDHLPI